MRQQERSEFIHTHGWGDADVTPLPGDASRRRYFRLTLPDGLAHGASVRLLMDMPRHPEEKFDEFILLSAHLRAAGLSAPEVYAFDAAQGFALIEDFGDATYTRLLNEGHAPEPLYETAIAAAAELQKRSDGVNLAIKNYDAEAMTGEISWFIEWYAPLYWQRAATAEEQTEFQTVVHGIFESLPPLKTTLLLRDFHVDNFMWLPDRAGLRRCGILDFQDAKWGSPAYDLVSILEDARRDIDPALAQKLYNQYLSLRPDLLPVDFAAHYAAMGMLRHARILGNFIRLWLRDDKDWYLQFMPRVQRQFENALQHPVATPLREWCAQKLPPLSDVWTGRDAAYLKKQLLAA